ncbi:MAG: hypothetical protein U1A16_01175 [Patescibacteria group bacterium]|nr:hypothetical protein [Patescibacteria group bacterium]
MDTALTTASTILSGAGRVLLLLSRYPTRDEIITLAILGLTLEHQGKTVIFPLAPIHTQIFTPTLSWPKGLTQTLHIVKESVIAINTKERPVSALRYEKSDTELRIYLTPKVQAIQSGDITVGTEESEPFDCILALNIPGSELTANPEAVEALRQKTPFIHLQTGSEHVYIEATHGVVLSAPLDDLLTTLTRLLAPLPLEAAAWQRERSGAIPLAGLRLLGRILARLTIERDRAFSFILGADFVHAGYPADRFNDTIGIFPFASRLFPKPFTLLWETGTVVGNSAATPTAQPATAEKEGVLGLEGLIVGDRKGLYDALQQKIPGFYTPDGYRIQLGGVNLETARLRVSETLVDHEAQRPSVDV